MSKSCIEISTEWDIVAARQIGRDEARGVGFEAVDQAKISTAVSELARYVYIYGGTGEIVIERIAQENKKGVSITAASNDRRVMSDLTDSKSDELERVLRLMDLIEIQANSEKGSFIKVQKLLE